MTNYKAVINMSNGTNIKSMIFDHPNLKTLKKDIKFIYNANKGEYPNEYRIDIIKYSLIDEKMKTISLDEYRIKGNRLYKI